MSRLNDFMTCSAYFNIHISALEDVHQTLMDTTLMDTKCDFVICRKRYYNHNGQGLHLSFGTL